MSAPRHVRNQMWWSACKRAVLPTCALALFFPCTGWTVDLTVMKGSAIVGTPVDNLEGQTLGVIQDLAIDPEEGVILYAVLSFGGFLGIGDKYFAIPWEALQVDMARKHFVLDAKKKDLKNAPGFSKSSWPDFADPAFTGPLYEYYEVPVPARSPSRNHREPSK